jgi:hypothetical protein
VSAELMEEVVAVKKVVGTEQGYVIAAILDVVPRSIEGCVPRAALDKVFDSFALGDTNSAIENTLPKIRLGHLCQLFDTETP